MAWYAHSWTALMLFASGAALVATPAAATSRDMTIRTQVATPLSISSTRDLNFGTIIRGTTAGTVTINARTGARTRTGGVALQGTVTDPTAAFVVTGTAGRLFRLTLSAGTITLNRVGGGATMTLNTLRVSHNGAAPQTAPRNFTIPAGGASTLAVGGRLNVGANQADGIYTGTFAVTADYQ